MSAVAERVFLHVGAPKSGTTFVQTVLWANRRQLAATGVLVPGRRRFDLNLMAKAVRTDLPDDESPTGPAANVWRRLARQAQKWPGTVVISNEWLSRATKLQAETALEALQPAELHVVFTARAFVTQIPAAWQETLRLGHATSLREFIDCLDAEDERWSWSTLDPAVPLARWGATLPPQQVHVVTVPSRGRDPLVLWRRFASLCGIDADACDVDVGERNESLTVQAASLLQRLGPQLRDAVEADTGHRSEAQRWIRRYLANTLLIGKGNGRIGLADDELAVVRERASRSVEVLRAAGYDIVGDLAELTADTRPADSRHPDDVSPEELLEVTAPVIVELLERVRAETQRADGAQSELRQIRRRLEQRDSSSVDPAVPNSVRP